jgi:hypothetical protein
MESCIAEAKAKMAKGDKKGTFVVGRTTNDQS